MAEGKIVGEKAVKEKKFSTNQKIIVGALFILFFMLLVAMNAARSSIASVPVLNLFLTVPSPMPFPIPDILPNAASPMFFAMPIVSFFFVFLLADWINSYFKTSLALHPLFVLLYFFLGFAAFLVALFWYNSNYALLGNQKLIVCLSDNLGGAFGTCSDLINSIIEAGKINEYIVVDYWQKLHGNAFMLFIWGGTFGWITRYAVEKLKL